MANRTLSTYVESTHGMTFRLDVERSASGQPGLFFDIYAEDGDGTVFADTCVFVRDGNEFLAPVIAWLNA